MSTTTEVEFDYQTYMKENTPEIYRGPEARQKRREAAEARKLPLRRKNRSEITIATVAEFHEQLGNLGTEDETNFLYRGQADVKWSVDCSAARRLTNYSANPIDDQLINSLLVGYIDDQLINSLLVGYLEFLIAKAKMRGFIPPGLRENSADLEFLAQLQHQGAATGLIDFTRQPLVALWFACNATRKADGAVYVLSRSATRAVSKRDLEDKTIQDFYKKNKLWLWEPSAIGNRIVAQGSIFVFGVPRIYPTQMKQLIVQADRKDDILKELETLYGINEEELFADFSGYAIANASSRIFDANRTIDYWHEQIELASDSNDNSKKVEAHFNCGVAYSAIKALDKSIEQYDKAIEQYDKMIVLDLDVSVAYYNRGNAYSDKGELDRAIQDYNKAIELNLNFADAYNNRGNAYSAKSEFDRAIQDCSKAIELNPNDAEAYNSRGIAYGNKDDFDQAIQDFGKAIDLKPDFAQAYVNRGNAYGNKDDFDQAIPDYNKAIDLKPDFAGAYNSRGIAYDNKGDFEQAIQDYNKAIDLKPDFADAYNSRGDAYSDKDDFDQAIQDYNKAVELNPNNAEAYYNRGDAYGNKDNFDQAISDYNKAIELKPDFADAYYNRGDAYGNKDNFDQAISDYNKAIELKPDFAEAYFSRGYTWLHLGEREKAKADLITAQNTGMDIADLLRADHQSVADFKREYGLALPEDIADLLTGETV